MDLVPGFQQLNRKLTSPVMTIGNFDGVHLGHQKIIRLAVEKARARRGECVAMTFRPHPLAYLRPHSELKLITTYAEKLDLLAALGVDVIIEQPFTPEFAELSAQEFFQKIILDQVKPEAIVIGYDFGFGKNREGNVKTLQAFSHPAGIEFNEVTQQQTAGEVISSSRIREHLLRGDVDKAKLLLGREFSYRGTVSRGAGRGKNLGFPTANIRVADFQDKLVLPYGVYVTHAVIDGVELPSVTNVGVRPTFDVASEFPAWIECHVLGFGDRPELAQGFYGKTLEVRFVQRLREERRFANVEQLKEAVLQDIRRARQILGVN
jgi:riboflavin kinase/FMN adenylyltransferase